MVAILVSWCNLCDATTILGGKKQVVALPPKGELIREAKCYNCGIDKNLEIIKVKFPL